MRPGAPSAVEASRGLSSVKTCQPSADDDIVTSVAYEPSDDAEPVSPELALVDPSLAERLRADLSEAPAEPEAEHAAAPPAEPAGESTAIRDQAPVDAPEPPAVFPVHDAPVALADPLSSHGDSEDATAAGEPERPSASVHVLRAAPAAEEAVVVVEPSIVPDPDPGPRPEAAREVEPEREPVVQLPLPTVPPPGGPRGRSAVSPLRRRSRFWHVLVLLATAMLFAGVVAVGVVVVSGLTDRDSGSDVTASGDPPDAAAPAPQSGGAQEPGAAPAPTENSQRVPAPRRFAWPPVAGALSYRFELFRGNEQVLRATTRNPVYELPASWRHEGRQERLTTGSYRWYVWPVLASGPADAAVVQARLAVP